MTTVKICKNCTHSESIGGDFWKCRNPEYSSSIDIVTGEMNSPDCFIARTNKDLCGHEARGYRQKKIYPRLIA